ncbi:meiosis-specific nuclear structural protein 1-like isoform X2 [Argopecten irradians]|uniref:meiosis-specific nuclear structural protein 1-like isoform X2 n=1 Tax=Argopecten irradians TaxID=31199 RepID=UPI0037203CB7
MASSGADMDPEDERRLIKNWTLVKNELMVDKILPEFTGIFSESTQKEIKNVQPNTRLMRADKFLHSLIKTGFHAYENFCEVLRRDSNRYKEVMEVLEIKETPDSGSAASSDSSRPSSNVSSKREHVSNGEKNKSDIIASERTRPSQSPRNLPTRRVVPSIDTSSMTPEQSSVAQMTQAAASAIVNTQWNNQDGVNVEAVEKGLVEIAPAIAELIKSIVATTSTDPEKLEEYHKVRNENEALRKTNRALVEQLNSFQQKIIQLQIENKKLRDTGEGTKILKDELESRATTLETIRKRLEEQKSQLEEKEMELNIQLKKIKEIEEERDRFSLQIMKLRVLHDDGLAERNAQKEQILELRHIKEKQQNHIELLEDIQRHDEEAMKMLEERLNCLEQYGTPRYQTASYQKSSTRARRNTRVVSPPRTMPWMNGMVSRSHHANVKFLPPSPSPRETKKEKGWSF